MFYYKITPGSNYIIIHFSQSVGKMKINFRQSYLPMPEYNKEYYSIWLENGSDNHGVQGCRERCAEGKAAPGAELEGARAVSAKKKFKITVLWNKVYVLLRKRSLFIDVFGTLPLRGVI